VVCVVFEKMFQSLSKSNSIFLINFQKQSSVIFDSYIGKTNSIFNDFKHLPVLHLISTT